MEEDGCWEGHEMRNAVKSSSWLVRDSKIWLQIQPRNWDKCRRMQTERSLSFSTQSTEIKDGVRRLQAFESKNQETPDDISSGWGKPDSLKGQSVISERSHFHLWESQIESVWLLGPSMICAPPEKNPVCFCCPPLDANRTTGLRVSMRKAHGKLRAHICLNETCIVFGHQLDMRTKQKAGFFFIRALSASLWQHKELLPFVLMLSQPDTQSGATCCLVWQSAGII